MREVIASNFDSVCPEIEVALRRAAFVSIDTELTGLQSETETKQSLFDTPEERYLKLKENIRPFVCIQFGLTTFQHVRDDHKYIAESFNFYLLPKSLPSKNKQIQFQLSALEFLCTYGFDFNKFAYHGISYVNEPEETDFHRELRENSLLRNVERFVSYRDEDQLKDQSNKVADWLAGSSNEQNTLCIETFTPLLQYLMQKELRNRFLNIWTHPGQGKITIVKVTNDVRRALEEEESDSLERALLDSYVGFTKIFKLMTKLKKPIVGHNLLLDLMYMHQQFYRPLPKKYKDFKSSIHELFPTIFDTKFLNFELRSIIKNDELRQANSLGALYAFFNNDPTKQLVLNSPAIESKEPVKSNEGNFHEAAWDSYCTGYCFIRMAHIFAANQMGKGSEFRHMTNAEILSGVKNFKNCVNIIRASTSYLKFDGPDPKSTRPQWLCVRTLGGKATNISQIAEMLSSFGAVDVKRYTSKHALVAVGNHGCARDILKHFQSHNKELHVAPYSLLRHSPAVRLLLWSGVIVSGGAFAWMLQRNIQRSPIT